MYIFNRALIFCTWGSSGAYVLDDKKHHAKAPSIEHVVDSVGAGDTFNAGIILALCHQLKTEKALEFACTLATLKVAQQGFDGLKDKVHSHFLYK
jgi:ketohexokinase